MNCREHGQLVNERRIYWYFLPTFADKIVCLLGGRTHIDWDTLQPPIYTEQSPRTNAIQEMRNFSAMIRQKIMVYSLRTKTERERVVTQLHKQDGSDASEPCKMGASGVGTNRHDASLAKGKPVAKFSS